MSGCEIDEKLAYPAQYHFRIIIESESEALGRIGGVLDGYCLSEPLQPGQNSSGGKYKSFLFSVEFECRADHERMDAELRAVEGVRILI